MDPADIRLAGNNCYPIKINQHLQKNLGLNEHVYLHLDDIANSEGLSFQSLINAKKSANKTFSIALIKYQSPSLKSFEFVEKKEFYKNFSNQSETSQKLNEISKVVFFDLDPKSEQFNLSSILNPNFVSNILINSLALTKTKNEQSFNVIKEKFLTNICLNENLKAILNEFYNNRLEKYEFNYYYSDIIVQKDFDLAIYFLENQNSRFFDPKIPLIILLDLNRDTIFFNSGRTKFFKETNFYYHLFKSHIINHSYFEASKILNNSKLFTNEIKEKFQNDINEALNKSPALNLLHQFWCEKKRYENEGPDSLLTSIEKMDDLTNLAKSQIYFELGNYFGEGHPKPTSKKASKADKRTEMAKLCWEKAANLHHFHAIQALLNYYDNVRKTNQNKIKIDELKKIENILQQNFQQSDYNHYYNEKIYKTKNIIIEKRYHTIKNDLSKKLISFLNSTDPIDETSIDEYREAFMIAQLMNYRSGSFLIDDMFEGETLFEIHKYLSLTFRDYHSIEMIAKHYELGLNVNENKNAAFEIFGYLLKTQQSTSHAQKILTHLLYNFPAHQDQLIQLLIDTENKSGLSHAINYLLSSNESSRTYKYLYLERICKEDRLLSSQYSEILNNAMKRNTNQGIAVFKRLLGNSHSNSIGECIYNYIENFTNKNEPKFKKIFNLFSTHVRKWNATNTVMTDSRSRLIELHSKYCNIQENTQDQNIKIDSDNGFLITDSPLTEEPSIHISENQKIDSLFLNQVESLFSHPVDKIKHFYRELYLLALNSLKIHPKESKKLFELLIKQRIKDETFEDINDLTVQTSLKEIETDILTKNWSLEDEYLLGLVKFLSNPSKSLDHFLNCVHHDRMIGCFAKLKIANCYLYGIGTKRDLKHGFKYLKQIFDVSGHLSNAYIRFNLINLVYGSKNKLNFAFNNLLTESKIYNFDDLLHSEKLSMRIKLNIFNLLLENFAVIDEFDGIEKYIFKFIFYYPDKSSPEFTEFFKALIINASRPLYLQNQFIQFIKAEKVNSENNYSEINKVLKKSLIKESLKNYLNKLKVTKFDENIDYFIADLMNSIVYYPNIIIDNGGILYEIAWILRKKDPSIDFYRVTAFKLFKLLATKGNHSISKYVVAMSILEGNDVQQDKNRGLTLLHELANLNNKYAIQKLGKLYICGKYVEEDLNKAAEYFIILIDQHQKYALEHLTSLTRYLEYCLKKGLSNLETKERVQQILEIGLNDYLEKSKVIKK